MLLAAGQTAKEAALSRGVSPYTISQTIEIVRTKLGAANTVAALATSVFLCIGALSINHLPWPNALHMGTFQANRRLLP